MDHPVHHLASSLTPRILFPRTLTLPSQVPRSHSDRKPTTQTLSCCVSLSSQLTINFLPFLLQPLTVPISASPHHLFPRVFQFLACFSGYPGSPFVNIVVFCCSHLSVLLDPFGVRAPRCLTNDTDQCPILPPPEVPLCPSPPPIGVSSNYRKHLNSTFSEKPPGATAHEDSPRPPDEIAHLPKKRYFRLSTVAFPCLDD